MDFYHSQKPVRQVNQVLLSAWNDYVSSNRQRPSASRSPSLDTSIPPLAGRVVSDSGAGSLPKPPCIAGVSGGIDSMVLLHIVAVDLGWPVVVAHVNYGLRGEESDADEILVRNWCADRKIRFEVVHAGAEMASRQSGNLQDHARNIRTQFYEKLKQQHQAWSIIVAHHRDDQLETIMQKILRGAPPDHWAGMRAISNDRIRPLLGIDKATLTHYARQCDIPYRDDRSNRSSRYARNLLRNDAFPKREKPFPGWKNNLLRVPEFALLHTDLLRSLAMQQPGDRLDRAWWLALPKRARPALLRFWIDERLEALSWSRGVVKRLNDAQTLQTGALLPLPSGNFLMRDREHFVLGGERREADQGLETICISTLKAKPLLAGNLLFYLSVYNPEEHGRMLQLRLNNLPELLLLRRWKAADRFQPLGLGGRQSVADHLTGRKYPAHLKQEVLVLEDKKGGIYALVYPGITVRGEPGTLSERARCYNKGEAVLCVRPSGLQEVKHDGDDVGLESVPDYGVDETPHTDAQGGMYEGPQTSAQDNQKDGPLSA